MAEFGSYGSKTLKTANFAPKKAKFWHIEYDFPKEDHKNNLHTKY